MNSKQVVESYYNAMNNKDLQAMSKFLAENVQFSGPLDAFTGKERLLKAAEGFFSFFNSVKLDTLVGDGAKVMLVYDWSCPPPVGDFRAAGCFTVENDVITRLELFYDARPFSQFQNQIFDKKN